MLGKSFPVGAAPGNGIVHHSPYAAVLFTAHAAHPEEQPVRPGTGHGRGKILITYGKGICKRIVESKIVAVIMSHRKRHIMVLPVAGPLGFQPSVVTAFVVRVDLAGPAVRY